MTRIAFNPIFESYAVVGVLAIGLLWLLLVRPRSQQLATFRRRALLGLRLLLICVLLLAMLRPSIVATTIKSQSAVFLLLFDRSRSMRQPAASGNATRWEEQRAVLEGLKNELAQFDERFELRSYGYEQQLMDAEVADGTIALPPLPTGDATDIGGCLLTALQRELGQRLAGVLLLGDGAQSTLQPAVELQQAAHELTRLDVPLYTVTFGPSGDAAQSRDIAIESMPDQFSVFVKNELAVEAAVRVRGFVNKEMDVELAVEDEQGNVQRFGPQHISASRDNELIPVTIPFSPDEPGEYRLTMRIALEPGELLSGNNELTAFLTVLEGGLQVLYLYGELNGEQKPLRQSIDAAPDIQLDDQFISLLDRNTWPIDLARWIEQGSYDAILIESVDVSAFSPEDMQAVSKLVGAGTGLMMLGGYSSFGAGGYQNSPWADLLPIEMGRFERQDLDPTNPISRDLHLWGNLAIRPARAHPLTQLAGGAANATTWSSLPALRGANKLHPKPASQVLLQTSRSEPVLVAGNYGRGRTLAFGGNTTSRWWRYGHENEHRRFWRQVILWLAQREDLTRNDVWIELDRRRYALGQEIDFTAGAMDALGEPINGVTVSARVLAPEGETYAVTLRQAGDSFRGSVDPTTQPGDYRIEISASHNGDLIGKTSSRIHVLENDVELSNPLANHQLMERLANATQAAGGKTVAAEEVADLLSNIRRAHQSERLEVEAKWELGDSAGSAWLLFLVIVGLVTTEWVCRKRWGLV